MIEKLSSGILRVVTPTGPRYIKPEFWQRAYFVWMFRHFETLPAQVISRRQHLLIERLQSQNCFVSAYQHGEPLPVLGTVDLQSEVERAEAIWKHPTAALRSAAAWVAGAVQDWS